MINRVNEELIRQHQQNNVDSIIESAGTISALSAATPLFNSGVDTTNLKAVLESVDTDGLLFDDACEHLYTCVTKK